MTWPNVQAFIAYLVGGVQGNHAATGWLPSLQIAQILDESARGTSQGAVAGNNLAGLGYTGLVPSSDHNGFAWYPGLNQFWTDYRRVQLLPYYNAVRQAEGINAQIAALAASPYDAGHYGGGGVLTSLVDQYNLTQYDPKAEAATPTPAKTAALTAAVSGNAVTLTATNGMPVAVDSALVVAALIALVALI